MIIKSDKIFKVEYRRRGRTEFKPFKRMYHNLEKAKHRGLVLLQSDTIEEVNIIVIPVYNYERQQIIS